MKPVSPARDRVTPLRTFLPALGVFLLAVERVLAIEVEDLPLLAPEVSAYQVSSHNKKGLNGDGGWYLHEGEVQREGLAGWADVDEGATAAYTKDRVHEGHGALVHTIRLTGRSTGWRSVRKQLSGGLNLDHCDRLSMFVWPTHADGQIDYAVRLDSGGRATQLDVRDLQPNQWNHVLLDVSKVQRQGVEAFWLLFQVRWGAVDGMQFFVDDIRFLQKDGTPFGIDDFETGVRRAVLFDAVGAGAIRNIWGLGEHDLRIEVDGKVIVDATQDDFFQGRVPGFPSPLVRKALVASGPWQCISHWSFVPIGFQERCRITTLHPAPFYHVIAERFRETSRAVPWSREQDLSALKSLWNRPGEDPKGWTGLRVERRTIDLAAGASTNLADLAGAGAVASLRLSLPQAKEAIESLWLRMDWDGGARDVEAPVGFFFGAGVRWQDVPSLCFGIRGDEGYCHFPMPFWKSARIRLENRGTKPATQIGSVVSWRPEPYPEHRAGYFRARFHEGPTVRGRDWVFLETEGQGQFVGVVHRLIGGHYCEGDIRFYLDGSRSPAFYGTGTEDYYHQACWPNSDNHTPFHGCTGDVAAEAKRAGGGKTFYDFPACYYRVHLEAPVRFRSAIRCGIEHGGVNDTDSRYASLAFWYGRDRIGLVQSDAVSFSGPGVESLNHFFEGDNDELAVPCALLKTTEPITRILAVDPANTGVRLRRVLDQSSGPQRALVSVDGVAAGTWYDPDRNPWKRLAESEVELPPRLVRGKTSIRVTFQPQEGAWTIGELRALSHVDRPLPAKASGPPNRSGPAPRRSSGDSRIEN
ncbi:MAG: DUF2961 domain-containing protein [Verrucomicrobia bacterium]|nr:DUF2961 domain-containing protein [Verrucomicrobiota bacterium]